MSCFCGSVWIFGAITCCFSFEAIGARFLCNGFELGVMSLFCRSCCNESILLFEQVSCFLWFRVHI